MKIITLTHCCGCLVFGFHFVWMPFTFPDYDNRLLPSHVTQTQRVGSC